MCEPTLLTALTLGVTGASGLFSAGSQMRQGERQGRLAVWQALQESEIGFREAALASEASLEEFQDSSQATIDQAVRGTRAYALAAEIARKNADLAMGRANVEEQRIRDETARGLASQTAYFAANNQDPTYGSPLVLAAHGAAQGESDALIARAGGVQAAAEQQWSAYSLADRADETIEAAEVGIRSAGKATKRGIETNFRTASTRGTSGNSAAFINASNARKAGQFGAATTLLNTASTWLNLGMGGKLSSIGIKGA